MDKQLFRIASETGNLDSVASQLITNEYSIKDLQEICYEIVAENYALCIIEWIMNYFNIRTEIARYPGILNKACHHSQGLDVIRLLISSGADTSNVDITDNLRRIRPELVQYLVKRNKQISTSKSRICVAYLNNDLEFVALLLDRSQIDLRPTLMHLFNQQKDMWTGIYTLILHGFFKWGRPEDKTTTNSYSLFLVILNDIIEETYMMCMFIRRKVELFPELGMLLKPFMMGSNDSTKLRNVVTSRKDLINLLM